MKKRIPMSPEWRLKIKEGVTRHGQCADGKVSGSYKSWKNMMARCLSKKRGVFQRYNGVTVCEEWKKFSNFYRDMGDRPDGKSIDRIDNSSGYSKENCRWSTAKEQTNNRRVSRRLFFLGKNMTVSEWADFLEIPYDRVYSRVKRNWPIEQVLCKKYHSAHSRKAT